MRQEIQSGQHPDADQLSAFVEHALPAHEQQQMLAHLAVCPECRATVAMSLPPVNESAARAEGARRGRWFTGWRLAFPAVAFAALTVLIVSIHNASSRHLQVNSSQQIATSHPPVPPIAERSKPINPPSPRDKKLKPGDPEAAMAANAGTSAGAVSNAETRAKQKDTLSSASNELNATTGLPPANAPARAEAQASAPPPTRELSAAPSAPQVAIADGANGGPALQPELRKDAAMAPQLSLPSGLPILSMATHMRQVVAIDTRNTLFVSEDGGASWKAVPIRWKGRAVKADLVSYGTLPQTGMNIVQGLSDAKRVRAGSVPVQPANASAQSAGVTLTGTVSDKSGAVIPGAAVTVTAPSGQLTRSATTDPQGQFVVVGLVPGVYDIKTQARGFQQQDFRGVNVSATQPNVIDVALEVGAVSETVTVQAENLDMLQSMPPKGGPKPPEDSNASTVFEITTDSGEHWTSPDGMTWKRK